MSRVVQSDADFRHGFVNTLWVIVWFQLGESYLFDVEIEQFLRQRPPVVIEIVCVLMRFDDLVFEWVEALEWTGFVCKPLALLWGQVGLDIKAKEQVAIWTERFQVLKDAAHVSRSHIPIDKQFDSLVIMDWASLGSIIPDSEGVLLLGVSDSDWSIYWIEWWAEIGRVFLIHIPWHKIETIGVSHVLLVDLVITGGPLGEIFTSRGSFNIEPWELNHLVDLIMTFHQNERNAADHWIVISC